MMYGKLFNKTYYCKTTMVLHPTMRRRGVESEQVLEEKLGQPSIGVLASAKLVRRAVNYLDSTVSRRVSCRYWN